MHDFRLLKILDIFRPLFVKLQIDYPILRYILAIKLLMDERRVPTILDDTKEKRKNPFIKSLWLYFLYSFILVFFVFGEALMLQMSIMFGVALFILMTALIADFSSVMLDVQDKTIFGTKPIDARTLGVAKFIHIMFYLILLTGAFTVIPIIFMLFVQGIVFTILFIIMLCLFVLFIFALTSLIYIFILKLFSGEQLKSMINYIQIIFAVGIIIGYQIIIRAYGFADLNAAYLFNWWDILLPPTWFAAPFELILNKNVDTLIIILSLLSVVMPLIAISVYYWLIPAFEANLQKLSETAGTKTKKKFSVENLWKGLLCRTEKSRAYFQFVYRIIEREREFKLKVYPSLGIGLVFPFIFIFSEARVRTFDEITEGNLYFCIYLMQIFIGIAVYTFQFSSRFKGAWIFTMSDDAAVSSQLYRAVIKVFLVKLYFPMFIFVSVVYYLIFDQFHFIDLATVFVSAVVQVLLSYKLTVESNYPFSLPFELSAENENMLIAVLLMLLTIPFVIFHFLSSLLPFVIYVYFLLLCGAAIYLWRKFLGSTK